MSRKIHLLPFVVLLSFLVVAGCGSAAEEPATAAPSAPTTVIASATAASASAWSSAGTLSRTARPGPESVR